MAYVKNWLHCLWGTKNKMPFLSVALINDIIEHIRSNAKEKGTNIDTLNEYGFDKFQYADE